MKTIKKWTVLEEKDISPSPWFPLFVHKVRLPNGKIISDFYVAKLGSAAMIVAITPKKELVLVRQYKHGVGEITHELPAGRIGKMSPEKAASKELEEETGIVADELIPLGKVCPTPTKDSTWIHGFLVKDARITTKQKLDSTENIEVVHVPINRIDKMIKTGQITGSDSVAMITLARLNAPELFC